MLQTDCRRNVDHTVSFCRRVGFALFLVGTVLSVLGLGSVFDAHFEVLVPAILVLVCGIALRLGGDLLGVMADTSASLRGIREELAKIAGQRDNPRD